MSPAQAQQSSDSIIPDEIARLAATYRLGPFLKVYRAQTRARAMLIGCPILILGPLLLCVGLAAVVGFASQLFSQIGLDTKTGQSIIGCIIVIAFGLLARVMFSAAVKIRTSGTVVYLFQNGIIHSRGKTQTPVFWQQIIRGQFLRGNIRNPDSLVLHRRDGGDMAIQGVDALSELAERVQQVLARSQPVQR